MSTQSDMSEELNCSEGARMLIDRMQTHPDDFKYNGRFIRIVDQLVGRTPVGYSELSDRDRSALTAAYAKYILEPSLTEYVVDEIFNGDKRREEERQATVNKYTTALAASMVSTKNAVSTGVLGSWTDPRVMMRGSAVNLTEGETREVYQSQGQAWFEAERKRLSEMTDRAIKKLKRDKSK